MGMLSKENKICSELTPATKKGHAFYTILTCGLFIIGAFTFWEFVYELCHMIAAAVSNTSQYSVYEAFRMLPLILTALAEVYMAVYCFDAYRALTQAKAAKIWKVNGVITVILGIIISGYVVFGVVSGQYAGFIEGFISSLFPLDFLIGGVLMILYGVLAIAYGKAIGKGHKGYVSCCVKGRFRPFHILSYMITISSFAACVYGLFIIDFSHGAIFFNVMLWLVFFMAVLQAYAYRFIYAEQKYENKPRASRNLGLIFFLANVVVFALYIISFKMYPQASVDNVYGVLPIEYTASFNAFLPVYAFNNLLVPLAAFIKGLIDVNKQKKA